MMAKTPLAPLLPSLTPSGTLKGVNNEIPSILLFMDETIEKLEEELARLRRSRAELAAAPDRRRLAKQVAPNQNQKATNTTDSSIGELLMEALRKNGSMTVKQIHRWVTASGKIAQYHTVSAMVSYYFKHGYIKRVSHGIYAVADDNAANIPPKPELTNGTPVPKALR
jgi:hypothetical protein